MAKRAERIEEIRRNQATVAEIKALRIVETAEDFQELLVGNK